MDGTSFMELTREDFSLIYPSNDKFLLGSRLYKIAMNARIVKDKELVDTNRLLDEMDELAGSSLLSFSHASTPVSSSPLSVSRASTPSSVSCSSTASTSNSTSSRVQRSEVHVDRILPKRRCVEKVTSSDLEFKLPVFSPDIKKCISKDGFYTSTQRNRLIKEACLALRGFCWEQGQEISNVEKRNLAKLLYQLAPRSLGDPGNVSKPEVRIYNLWFNCLIFILYI